MAIRGGLYIQNIIPAPRNLANSALSPQVLSLNFARDLINMIPSTGSSGSIAKRFGTKKLGAVIGAGVITELMYVIQSDGVLQIVSYTDDGRLHTLDDATGVWTTIKTGLNILGTIRWTHFNSKLIIVNGMDNNMVWDGTTLTDMSIFVIDQSSNMLHVDSSTVTFDTFRGDNSDFPIGRNVKVTFDTAGTIEAVVANNVFTSPTITLLATGTPFPAVVEAIIQIEYEDSPIPFSFIFQQHSRLWALATGELKATVFNDMNNMTVFYTATPNNENSWFNVVTQNTPFIDMSNKHLVSDQLVGIAAIDGNMLFIGRERSQLWGGTIPIAGGDFSWVKTIPVGCVHGNLISYFPRDVLIFTRYGARSFRTVFQTETLESVPDIGSNIDPVVQAAVSNLMSSDENYKQARSWFYHQDGFFGFKIFEEPLVYAISEEVKGWTKFTGKFETATAYLGLPDGRLIVGEADQLLLYSNGIDGETPTFSDDGAAIRTEWFSPWIEQKARWQNRYWEFITDSDNMSMTIQFTRMKDNDISNGITFNIETKGQATLWDVSSWDIDDWDSNFKRALKRDKFLATSYAFRLVTNTTTGPFEIVGVKVIGSI